MNEIIELANQYGFDSVSFLGKWKTYDVYEPVKSDAELTFTGLPLVILKEDDKVRMSTPEEAIELVDYF